MMFKDCSSRNRFSGVVQGEDYHKPKDDTPFFSPMQWYYIVSDSSSSKIMTQNTSPTYARTTLGKQKLDVFNRY